MDRMERVLRTAQGCTAGVWVGMSLYRVWDYKARPGWYAMAPDPWYRSIVIIGVVAAAAVILLGIAKKIGQKKRNGKSQEE